jgi:2-amino-4-hydroxy-6-hydroxymethyldihydropteridine diphosphokinase
MPRCFIALGSNLDHPEQQLRQALAALAALPASTLHRSSPFYRSRAVGPGDQPDYFNAVCELTTALAPLALLDQLQAIEQAQGRRRELRWGARTLDLDLLLYGDEIINLPRLQVPHPRLFERDWVLYPLADLDPALQFPDGTALRSRLDSCPVQTLIRP